MITDRGRSAASRPSRCFAPRRDSRLERFFEPYIALAKRHQTGMILDTPTWRANPDWGAQLGFDASALANVNRTAVYFVEALRRQHAETDLPFVLNGVIEPRGDSYKAEAVMSANQGITTLTGNLSR